MRFKFISVLVISLGFAIYMTMLYWTGDINVFQRLSTTETDRYILNSIYILCNKTSQLDI